MSSCLIVGCHMTPCVFQMMTEVVALGIAEASVTGVIVTGTEAFLIGQVGDSVTEVVDAMAIEIAAVGLVTETALETVVVLVTGTGGSRIVLEDSVTEVVVVMGTAIATTAMEVDLVVGMIAMAETGAAEVALKIGGVVDSMTAMVVVLDTMRGVSCFNLLHTA